MYQPFGWVHVAVPKGCGTLAFSNTSVHWTQKRTCYYWASVLSYKETTIFFSLLLTPTNERKSPYLLLQTFLFPLSPSPHHLPSALLLLPLRLKPSPPSLHNPLYHGSTTTTLLQSHLYNFVRTAAKPPLQLCSCGHKVTFLTSSALHTTTVELTMKI